jgi:glycosyltransferase involved in cell wall biosynthesis
MAARSPVSAVIPCFRSSATLARALDSIAAQTRPPEETLLVDDGNDAGEAAALQAIAGRFAPIGARVIRLQQNRGPGSARNAGWAEARAPLVAFLDADDAWHPRKLELQVPLLLAQPELTLCGHGERVLRPGEALPSTPRGTGTLRPIGRLPLLVVNPLATRTWLVRRDESVRFAEGKRHVEDHLLLMELVLRGRTVGKLDLELAALFKPALSRSGLSSQLWAMERGELDAYARLRAQSLLGASAWASLSALSLVKFVRRIAVVKLLR